MNKYIKYCKFCGKEFTPLHHRKYCSTVCFNNYYKKYKYEYNKIHQPLEYHREYNKKKKGLIPLKYGNCIICGNEYKITRRKQKYCKECKGKKKVCYEIKSKYYNKLNDFIQKYCILDKNRVIKKRYLYKAINEVFKDLNDRGISIVLSRKWNIKKNTVTYLGIDLNELGWKTFFPMKYQKLSFFKNIELNSINVCKEISCNPTVKTFNEIYSKYFNKEENEKIIYNIKQIEKRMYRKNLYRTIKNKIAVSIYISTDYTQQKISEIMNVSESTISNLCNILELKKFIKKKENKLEGEKKEIKEEKLEIKEEKLSDKYGIYLFSNREKINKLKEEMEKEKELEKIEYWKNFITYLKEKEKIKIINNHA